MYWTSRKFVLKLHFQYVLKLVRNSYSSRLVPPATCCKALTWHRSCLTAGKLHGTGSNRLPVPASPAPFLQQPSSSRLQTPLWCKVPRPDAHSSAPIRRGTGVPPYLQQAGACAVPKSPAAPTQEVQRPGLVGGWGAGKPLGSGKAG